MKKIDSWLTKHGLKNRLTLVVIVIFIIFLILLFMFVNLSDEDTGQITITAVSYTHLTLPTILLV